MSTSHSPSPDSITGASSRLEAAHLGERVPDVAARRGAGHRGDGSLAVGRTLHEAILLPRPPTARPARVRGGVGLAGSGDRSRPPDGAVLRRVHDRVGEHRSASCWCRCRSGTGSEDASPTAIPHKQGLCTLVLVAALAVGAIPFVADPFLDISVDALDDVSAGAFIGSLVAVSVLVAPPVMLLGAASPYAIRLAVERVEESGTVAGRMYAISTIGSLAGTWTSALLLMPLVGTRRTFLIFGLACAMVAVTGIARRAALAVPAVIVALLALPVGTIKAAGDGVVLDGGRDRVPVRARRREAGRRARARAERGPGGPFPVPARVIPDRRLLGRVPRAAVRRALVAAPGGGDPRQRRRHHGARPGPLLPRHVGRCRRDRLRADRARAALVRPAQSPDARAPRGRAAVPAPDRRRATTRSWSTSTASPTSRSTWPPGSSSSWCATA